jgi:hypothetical protein
MFMVSTAIHSSAGILLPLNLYLILNFKDNEDKMISPSPEQMQQQQTYLTKLSVGNEPNASNKLAMFSAKASAVTAAKMLDFVREMSLGTEDFSQRQSDYWIFVLQDYPPALIERAFHQWVKQSKHMPVPSEIIAILDAMVAAERCDRATRETNRYLIEMRHTRQQLAKSGQLHGEAQYHELMKRARETVKKFPVVSDPNKPLPLKQYLLRVQEEERRTPRKPAAHAKQTSEVGKQVS